MHKTHYLSLSVFMEEQHDWSITWSFFFLRIKYIKQDLYKESNGETFTRFFVSYLNARSFFPVYEISEKTCPRQQLHNLLSSITRVWQNVYEVAFSPWAPGKRNKIE
jgi:hypothetical protein